MALVIANWKMNKTVKETEEYIDTFKDLVKDIDNVEIGIAPPFTSLYKAMEGLKDSNIKLVAQNMFYKDKGAFTGEISPLMLKELNVEYVLLGHSERRHIFGEKDDLINKKVISAIEYGIRPILCVGETLEEKEQGLTFKTIERQIRNGLAGVEKEANYLDIAYEPVWAIGTGQSAKPEEANKVHKFIKELLNDISGGKSENTRVLYGGSVKPNNAKGLIKEEYIDGFLIGSAGLDPHTLYDVISEIK